MLGGMELWTLWLALLRGALTWLGSSIDLGAGLSIVVLTLALRALLVAIVQLPVFLGLYQVLRGGIGGARFLWVQSLAKPDLSLALLTGLTTAVLMLATPDLPPATRLVLILVPSLLATLAALKFSSALAVYWTVSNCCSVTQAVVLKHVVGRRDRGRGDRARPLAD
jgi:membrane protein insertase Oxa1/YidC/SpoIIIJ